jgi:hypothetical protein
MFKPKGSKSQVPFRTYCPKTPSGCFFRDSSASYFPDSGILIEKLLEGEESSGQFGELLRFAIPNLIMLFSIPRLLLAEILKKMGHLRTFCAINAVCPPKYRRSNFLRIGCRDFSGMTTLTGGCHTV